MYKRQTLTLIPVSLSKSGSTDLIPFRTGCSLIKKVIVFPECAFQSNAEADPTKSNEIEKKIENNLDNIVTPIIEWI